ncbi:MAG TPA: hypothetical protein V6C64_04630 [Microcoleaceae cyanobacterium]
MPKSLGASAEEISTTYPLPIGLEFLFPHNLTWSHWHMNCSHTVSNTTNGDSFGHSKGMAGMPLTSPMSA